MGMYLGRRIAAGIVSVWLATVVVFIGVHAAPGDPSLIFAGDVQNPERIAAIREKYRLDDSATSQYIRWVSLSLRGDLGNSVRGPAVTTLVLERLPVTLQLAFFSIIVAAAVGIPAGVLAARYRNTVVDYLVNVVGLIGLSVPNFWLGLMAILLFAVRLDWLPASGFVSIFDDPLESVRRLIMPALVLGTTFSAVIMRQMRSAMLETLKSDFVRTAWAKGLSPLVVVWRHALRNSLTVVLTILGLQLGRLISGSVVVEAVFVLPGLGRLLLDGIFRRDYAIVQGAVLVVVTGYVLINLLTDIGYSVINPRVRLSGSRQ